MKIWHFLLVFLLFLSNVYAQDYNEILVVTKDYESLKSISKGLDIEPLYNGNYKVKENSDVFDIYSLKFPKNLDVNKIIKKYKRHSFIEDSFLNYNYKGDSIVPNDPLISQQWHLEKIDLFNGYEHSMGDEDITIAVLDSGVNLYHEDLKNKLMDGYDFVDDDFVPLDDHGHGTKMAGIIGAETNNSKGVASLGPKIKIMPLRICKNLDGESVCSVSDLLEALIYLKDKDVNVISMSFSGSGDVSLVEEKINELNDKGIISVASAGNQNSNIPRYPAAYENVLSVGATDYNDNKLSSSNWGYWVDISAPGYSILSTSINGYEYTGGTSSSAAMVSGLVGLILSKNSDLDFFTVKKLLNDTSDETFGFFNNIGRINVSNTLDFVPLKKPKPVGGSPIFIKEVIN